MGILAKMAPKKMPAVLDPIVPKSMKSTAPSAPGDPDDEATLFTTFMVLFYGFFGITCLVYPYVHAADGPFTNPMAYWTTMSIQTAFAFRMFGATVMTLILGPFLDEIFGGVGVKMMAFTRQVTIGNLLIFVLFCYYSYYAPLATSVTTIWKYQAGFQGFLLGWNVVEAFTTPACTFWYAVITTAQFCMFGVTLAINGAFFWGANNPIYGDAFEYFSDWPELGMLCSRSVGVALLIAFGAGYYFYGQSGGYLKLLTVWNIVLGGLCVLPAYYPGSSSSPPMWQIQVAIQIVLATIGLYLEISGVTGPWKFSMACPKWGLNAETFNFVNLFFYLPFVAAFFTDPNLVFGPATPTGMPLFTTDFKETGLWFGRTWATLIFFLTLQPYVFGMPALKVTKQFVLAYFAYTAFFAYWILTYEIFNTMMAIPLGVLNLIFFIWALLVVLPANSGEAML